jgi:hypothetical protein
MEASNQEETISNLKFSDFKYREGDKRAGRMPALQENDVVVSAKD